MSALVLALLSPLLQETHELKWGLKEGQVFACSWLAITRATTPDIPEPLMDITIELKGELTVVKLGPIDATCELNLAKYLMKGTVQGSEIDILFENGALVRPAPDSENGPRILRECRKPLPVRLKPNGAYSVGGAHIAQGLFDGQSDFFGSQLPAGPVAVGATWEGKLESPQAKAQRRDPLKVKYTLESMKDGLARITLDDRQEVKAAGRTLDFRAVTESTFNAKAGHCAGAKATIHVNDMTDPARKAPEKPDIVMTLVFEMSPKK